jgi:hypothetical protein
VSWLFTEKRWHVSRGAGYVVPQETWDRYQKAEMVVWQIHDEIIGQHAYIGSIDRANPNQRNQP